MIVAKLALAHAFFALVAAVSVWAIVRTVRDAR